MSKKQSNQEEEKTSHILNVKDISLIDIKECIKNLTSDERLDLFADYCKYCGDFDADRITGCQCWNDE